MESITHLNKIKSIKVINISDWDNQLVSSKIEEISRAPTDELYLLTPMSVDVELENLSKNQTIKIKLKDTNNSTDDEIAQFIYALGQLRDYYTNLTIQLIDQTDKILDLKLSEDIIIKV